MRLLEGWSHGTSYGVPVGPSVSNLLAEALLVEVDEYVLSTGVEYLRYVDDYVLLTHSEPECLAALHALGTRLLQSEGLTLNTAKTRVWQAKEFVMRRLAPESKSRTEIRRRIVDEVFGGDIYADVEYADLTDEQRLSVDSIDARAWLDESLAEEPADLDTVRFVLNFLSAFRRPELIDPVVESLPRLFAVSEAVARFFSVLDRVDSRQQAQIGERLMSYLLTAQYVPDYQAMWLLDPFTKAPTWNSLDACRRLARNHRHALVRRHAVLALGMAGDRSALLDTKLAFEGMGEWEARAAVFACRSLPRDEREAFYTSIPIGSDWTRQNVLMKATLAYAKAKA
jgi:hypothetical protein